MKQELPKKASREFNKYHSPECRVKILYNGRNELVAEFSGSGSFFCCFDENFEDYRYQIKDIAGVNLKIKNVKKVGNKFIVTYTL